ncbi:hypothetical protein DW322_08825 [Rhodococcus rhodnii]|uniref:Phage head-tail adaptor n=2 Tax=Rhodococcus rhodnii TaxID=38312 RepID=R7WRF3_9NOCA|nr:hypothetical protein [Rhodococcus rhodnii]EOM77907.1 hypothetical protein Rrhod_0716 [Rhodococcus rhodnii LMG 5362]TXG90308.1 hypothetical protein DW322_08825 [Rhodococcus rhodnii]
MTSWFEREVEATLHRRVVGEQRDDRGRAVTSFVDERIRVWAYYLAEIAVDLGGHVGRVRFDGTIYPATSTGVRVRDEITVPQGRFRVEHITDWDNNPLWRPGLADAKLRKVDG